MTNPSGDRPKCWSCGGDMYHYAGCGVGEHGERLDSGDRPDAGQREPASETEAVLMAQDVWRSTDAMDRSDKECPPVVYGIARAAFRIGLRAAALKSGPPLEAPGEPTSDLVAGVWARLKKPRPSLEQVAEVMSVTAKLLARNREKYGPDSMDYRDWLAPKDKRVHPEEKK